MQLPVSVIIPTYNRVRLVGRALRSALGALQPGDEVIVIDDGSTDDTERVLSAYGHRIRYIRTANQGSGPARNQAIAEARNPLVAFLDSDDEWLPWRLDLPRAVLAARPDVLFCFSNFLSDHNGKIYEQALRYWYDSSRPWDDIIGPGVRYSSLARLPAGWADFDCYIGDLYLPQLTVCHLFTSTVTVRREEAGEALQFASDLAPFEDWYCYSRLARKGPGAYLGCETAIQHCYECARLTDADTLVRASMRLLLRERIWGSDAAFLQVHGELYRALQNEGRLQKAKGLIAHGRVREARAELSSLPAVPALVRTLAALPGPVAAGLFDLRRRFGRTPDAS